MNTTLKQGHRVYQIKTSVGDQMFCNIEQLNEVVKHLQSNAGYFKIYHFWNGKAELLSKKVLDQMFEGSQLKREFEYSSK